ncbi:MAG: hypothetical protein GX905_05735 [Bacteroidales bacterium]|nr:hypothetical protein [Bacteroidales bacterium]
MGTSKNKLTLMMKKKFETCYKLKIGVNNVDIFVDKYVYRHRLGGILLSTWENISGQVLMLCLLIGSTSSVLGLIYECGKGAILSSFSVGILTSGLLIVLEGILNTSTKKELIRLNMKDYLENFFKVRLEQELLHPELIQQYKDELRLQEGDALAVNSSYGKETTLQSILKSEKRTAKNQQKEAERLEKDNRKRAQKAARVKSLEEKKRLKEQKQDELKQKRMAAREMQERIQREAKLALEKERESKRAEIAQKKAEIIEEELRKKEEKQRQEEIRKALIIEKQSIKEGKKKNSPKQKTIAQERKESLKKEIQKRRSLEGHEGTENITDVNNRDIFTSAEKSKPAILATVPVEKIKIEKYTIKETPKAHAKIHNKREKQVDPTEEKLIEDILKEFLA